VDKTPRALIFQAALGVLGRFARPSRGRQRERVADGAERAADALRAACTLTCTGILAARSSSVCEKRREIERFCPRLTLAVPGDIAPASVRRRSQRTLASGLSPATQRPR
jgi:hypothetical protein